MIAGPPSSKSDGLRFNYLGSHADALAKTSFFPSLSFTHQTRDEPVDGKHAVGPRTLLAHPPIGNLDANFVLNTSKA